MNPSRIIKMRCFESDFDHQERDIMLYRLTMRLVRLQTLRFTVFHCTTSIKCSLCTHVYCLCSRNLFFLPWTQSHAHYATSFCAFPGVAKSSGMENCTMKAIAQESLRPGTSSFLLWVKESPFTLKTYYDTSLEPHLKICKVATSNIDKFWLFRVSPSCQKVVFFWYDLVLNIQHFLSQNEIRKVSSNSQ